ncbi:histidine--tRNA ligase [Gaetbulibacter sp. PBL-D1]|uniref:histidine--tRNA ligase n=1 Tax=Gaetbulibacter sp. PBL-D1 TaxID=3422594 RepID=UPI003D2EB0FD
MAQKPSIPKGTRDFNPIEVAKRNYIFDTIKAQFQHFGFQPIETPSFENSETLMGKYGDEGDRLIFKILNSGDFLRDFNENLIKSIQTALVNLRKSIDEVDNDEFDFDGFRSNFLKEFPIALRSITNIKFDERLINLNTLSEDIVFRIYNIVLKSNVLREKLYYDENLKFPELTNIIFADFYFQLGNKYVGNYITEKALRYDLTVPFARYVVQHQNEIDFPFKRYQMQPVWRADRPQKGRFREFYQCDADVVGSQSLWQEVEFVQLYDAVFSALKLEGVTIKINNRKILSGIAEVIGAQDKLIDFTVALDKLDKIGEEKVKEEMLSKGISKEGIEKLQPLFELQGDFSEQIEALKAILSVSEEGKKGIEELEFINTAISELKLQTANLQLDVTLARGLNYYTGAIFEVSAPEGVKMGSIGGGGRYDDLTGIFGLKDVSGVGISFGLDRIYLVLEELNLFPETISESIKVLCINFGEAEALTCLKAIKALRAHGINAELYPDAAKMKKQMNYANKRAVPYVVLVGESEMSSNTFTLKNMTNGEQQQLSLEDLITTLQ